MMLCQLSQEILIFAKLMLLSKPSSRRCGIPAEYDPSAHVFICCLLLAAVHPITLKFFRHAPQSDAESVIELCCPMDTTTQL